MVWVFTFQHSHSECQVLARTKIGGGGGEFYCLSFGSRGGIKSTLGEYRFLVNMIELDDSGKVRS